MSPPVLFSAKRAARIVERAASLQKTTRTLEELRAHAASLGLDPLYVEMALAEAVKPTALARTRHWTWRFTKEHFQWFIPVVPITWALEAGAGKDGWAMAFLGVMASLVVSYALVATRAEERANGLRPPRAP